MNRFLRVIGRQYPTLVFGLPGILMLVAGLAVGVLVTMRILSVHVVPVGTTVISVSLCIAGAMCIFSSMVLSTVGKLEGEIEGRRLVPGGDAGVSAPPVRQGSSWAALAFGLAGVLAVTAGLLWGAWAVYSTFTRGGLLPGSYIGSSSACIAGLMSLLAGITLHALQEVLADVQGAG